MRPNNDYGDQQRIERLLEESRLRRQALREQAARPWWVKVWQWVRRVR